MDTLLFLSFIAVSIGFIVIPGPNVLVIVSTSIHAGRSRGLQTVAGTSVAMAGQLLVAATASLSFIHIMGQGLTILKWLGIAYLLYLSVQHFRKLRKNEPLTLALSAPGSFLRGFFVSISNPKTIVFFTAFLPQFVSPSYPPDTQLFILSLVFLLLAVILDSMYALAGSHVGQRLGGRDISQIQHGISGTLYFMASLFLAANTRSQ